MLIVVDFEKLVQISNEEIRLELLNWKYSLKLIGFIIIIPKLLNTIWVLVFNSLASRRNPR